MEEWRGELSDWLAPFLPRSVIRWPAPFRWSDLDVSA
jgi:hypothetical protein